MYSFCVSTFSTVPRNDFNSVDVDGGFWLLMSMIFLADTHAGLEDVR